MEVFPALILWSFFPLIAGFIAAMNGRSVFKCSLMGLLLGPFALVILIFLRRAPSDKGGNTFANPDIRRMVSRGIYRGWKEGKVNLYRGETDSHVSPRLVNRNIGAQNYKNMSIGRPVKIIHTNVSKRKADFFQG